MDAIDLQSSTHLLGISLFSCLAIVVTIYLLTPDYEAAVLYRVPVPEQCTSGWKGEELEKPGLKLPGSTAIQCYNPANGRILGIVNPVTQDGIDRAVQRAAEAQVEWKKTTWSQRRKWLRTLKRHILDNQTTIVTAACLDSGKTRVDAYFGELLVTLEKIEWTLKHGEKSLRPERRPTNLLMCYKANEVHWEPLGVVAAAVSWNYPFHNLLSPIISSLFAGNSIILKPSERTAWSSSYFVSIARASLVACGHSPQLIQSCVCWPSTAPYLVSHPGISHLTFIGSRAVAHEVSRAATASLVPLCLELGGKDPSIILDDVADSETELNRVVAILMRGVFQAAGQNCIGIERIIAQGRVYPRLLEKLEPLVRGLRAGDPLDMSPHSHPTDIGACVSDANFPMLESLISEAVAQGARLLVGGKRFNNLQSPKGHYFQPTLIVDVTPTMQIAQTELFAPVMLLMRAASTPIDDAISIANSAPFGLGSSVYGRNKRDLEKVTRDVKAGMVAVNDFAAYYAVQLPFGGVGGSGYGRFAGREGLRNVCNAKAVCRDRWVGIKTTIPGPLTIPFGGLKNRGREGKDIKKAERRAEETVRGVIELGYGDGVWQKAGGLRRILGF
ncbi:Aldedh-domain-containing protein [Rhizodiscina lignyota]|uniref:aldehyde dehydrogenase (NAD(+)) n=1 Tax=Rhizodiscina lignyota TaxID=1504668 RepID=A0A9P4IAV2_9PEZI|nr:Aldedh-domain-containing protein [Rhizodiscina lignyota]